ncbi:MAG: hypothetical protein ACU0DH_06275 [Paracoccus sp. (in: a-proteobacteria)]|uniref:hypothetical protein n=1 Tax=Paracoccus sp. TaxID=267 RepID=UPI004059C524
MKKASSLPLPRLAGCIAAIAFRLAGSIVANDAGDQAVSVVLRLVFSFGGNSGGFFGCGCLCRDPCLLLLLRPRLRLQLLAVFAPFLARRRKLQLFLLPRNARRFGGFHAGAVALQQRSFRIERGSTAIGDVIQLGISHVFILFHGV